MKLRYMIRSPFFVINVFIVLLFVSCEDSKPQDPYQISVKLNPYGISPLSAQVKIKSDKRFNGTLKVLGESPIEQSFEMTMDSLFVPVLGLYPNEMNKVLVTMRNETETIVDTLTIKTQGLPNQFPRIEINKLDRDGMEPGWHGCDIHFANFGKFNSMPLIFDDQGIVRWYLDLGFAGEMMSPFQRLKDGNILVVNRHGIYEFDMLGKLLNEIQIDRNLGMHHDVLELPDGNLLICIGKRDAYIKVDGETIQSDSDFIMLFDRKNTKILKEWDLASHLDVGRADINFMRKGDWLHMNGLAYDSKDKTIIVSGKHQGLIKIGMNDELKWILAPKKNWNRSGREGNGKKLSSFLLTAIDSEGRPFSNSIQNGETGHQDFDFAWGQHAPKILPNGNLLVFDNGSHRYYKDDNKFSRVVEYHIDDKMNTVQQVWQYGKEKGESLYSAIVSDVDYLPVSSNILVTSGHISPQSNHSAKIIEVNKESGKEVFEATLYLKSVNGKKINSWGQMDILYRSQRMELRY